MQNELQMGVILHEHCASHTGKVVRRGRGTSKSGTAFAGPAEPSTPPLVVDYMHVFT